MRADRVQRVTRRGHCRRRWRDGRHGLGRGNRKRGSGSGSGNVDFPLAYPKRVEAQCQKLENDYNHNQAGYNDANAKGDAGLAQMSRRDGRDPREDGQDRMLPVLT